MKASLVLRDGRSIAFAEYGLHDGRPVFYFHGFPGSRLEAGLASSAASRLGVRVIAMDRPGVGGSTFQPGRRMTDWTGDVEALADHLGLDRFAVLGASGGAPYALACAWGLKERLTGVALVAGLPPVAGKRTTEGMPGMHRLSLFLARTVPGWTPLWMIPVTLLLRTRPRQLLAWLARRIGEPDARILRDPHVQRVLIGSLSEAERQGARGLALELRLIAAPWGFDPSSIRMSVQLWHGDRDHVIPVSMARRLAGMIPGSHLRILEDEGHFSLILGHLPEILSGL